MSYDVCCFDVGAILRHARYYLIAQLYMNSSLSIYIWRERESEREIERERDICIHIYIYIYNICIERERGERGIERGSERES